MRNNSYAHNWEARVSHSKTETRKKMCVNGSLLVLGETIPQAQNVVTGAYWIILSLFGSVVSVSREVFSES